MRLRNIQYSILVVYACISFAGLLYTLFRIRIPFIDPFAQFSYQMMAPYQGYSTHTKDILLEGQLPDGTWERIDHSRYFPYGDGERTVRIHFHSLASRGEEYKESVYEELAKQILQKERAAGKRLAALRLSIEQWPLAPAQYEGNRNPDSTQTLYSVTVSL